MQYDSNERVQDDADATESRAMIAARAERRALWALISSEKPNFL